MSRYVIDKKYFSEFNENQIKQNLSIFEKDENGNIEIEYTSKKYFVNNLNQIFKDDVIAISMFSGAGGLDIGCQLAGVKVLSSLDSYNDSVETLKKNEFFKDCDHMLKDIHDVTLEDYSALINNNKDKKIIIIGGPPCQPFSKAGYWVTNEKRNSINDPRNLIEPYFKIISKIKPDGFILENVESILHPSNSEAIKMIERWMKELNYNYTMLKINAADYGIPQKRKRVFFLASKKEIRASITKTHGDKKEIINNPKLLPYERVIDWIGEYDNDEYNNYSNIEVTGKYEHELKCIPFGKNYISLSEKENYPNPVFIAGKRYWTSLLKLHPFEPSWTIIASPGHWEGPFHWNNRRLNIKEIAAIQTFPADYKFFGSYYSIHKQIGNAVPPLLGKLIVEELLKWI